MNLQIGQLHKSEGLEKTLFVKQRIYVCYDDGYYYQRRSAGLSAATIAGY
jgi:hypothetical protein